MDTATARNYISDPAVAGEWLAGLGVVDGRRGHGNLLGIARAGVPFDLLAELFAQLERHLPGSADADMALNNLERFFRAARNPLGLAALVERDAQTLPTLLQIFAASQYLSDLLATDPESLDLLRLSEGHESSRQSLVNEITAEVLALEHEAVVMRALRRFKRREILRIAYGDIIREQSMRAVTMQISFLADALLEAALQAARRKLESQRGKPRRPDGAEARFVVLALGKLGGLELNYSSDIDLIFLCEGAGATDGKRPMPNVEYFGHLARELVRMLTERTELGGVYRVDMRLRPEGSRGPMVMDVGDAAAYYDARGRTWERQAYIKARPAAGDLPLGREFLDALTPWIYRRYLSYDDISGVKALKRRIERGSGAAAAKMGTVPREIADVKTGRGGIRDIEFVIQFLQLLNGGDLPELRTGNTLEAIARLEQVGCLTDSERSLLEENYTFLRRIEHRLQIMLDLQTHLLPGDGEDLRKLALRMGYADACDTAGLTGSGFSGNAACTAGQAGSGTRGQQTAGQAGSGARAPHSKPPGALELFVDDFRRKTALNRGILDHLLHDAFSDDRQTQPEVDLVLDPDPPPERIEEVLTKYRFRDPRRAYRRLMSLAEERSDFLSTRRCRHFLASIAPRLLPAIAATADPDSTLTNLDKVSDSLGGKGVLWELFSFNPPTLRLYVELCAYSPFLSDLLTNNPGMIDGLMDGLVLDKPPTREELGDKLAELCRGAEDIAPILHSFKNDQQLCVGVRDILGKEDVRATTGALSDIAETCLSVIAARESMRLSARYGPPAVGDGPRAGEPCELVVLALGKLGGREMNYHSDLDLIFLYEAEGGTAPPPGSAAEKTSNQHYFSELGQRIIKAAGRANEHGRLYEIDMRLRPTGRSGALAVSFDEFARYFAGGGGQLWERQSLCKARVIHGSARAAESAGEVVARAAFDHPWQPSDAAEIRRMRGRLEETAAAAGDLKRGPGGIVDIEFIVQMLQLKHARENPRLRQANTLAALAELNAAGLLADEDRVFFERGYRLLRTIEGRLRLMNSTARDRLPVDPVERTKLAALLRYPDAASLLADYESAAAEIRRRFDRIIGVY
ncbi:MAG: bifunctional [glutamate--ammonia ligase]-adenylyl-L-tyrosine phosphorylase/[glutamate--ammonia-ligase] adenylyltransferase [Pirellulaceae bacterium]|nr:bifunctional [glutamate--ammonia ligase]-adenylyl-L-tyrosine phosphorylase/[glutamate--ammonia-ligase] adenylyltransferase [Pirellulaceae bacterium]